MTKQNDNINEYDVIVDVHEGISKKSNKPYEALKITIGEYQTFVFPTKIEMQYIKHILDNASVD